jgi:hypothetical protein
MSAASSATYVKAAQKHAAPAALGLLATSGPA